MIETVVEDGAGASSVAASTMSRLRRATSAVRRTRRVGVRNAEPSFRLRSIQAARSVTCRTVGSSRGAGGVVREGPVYFIGKRHVIRLNAMVLLSRDFINRGTMPLVGRSTELGTLLEAFNDLLEGNPRAVWMTGAPGVGKSRLLDELKERTRAHTARSLVVHAKWYEGDGIEFGPLSNALEVLKPVIAANLASRIFREGTVISAEAAVEAVQVASRRYPVILIFDDLHYLDSSEELGKFVAALEEIPALIIVTTRPADIEPLRAFRHELARSHAPQELEIGPLDGAAIAEAAEELFGEETPSEMLGQIADLSAGVPLALREVFRELIAASHVTPSANGDRWEWNTESLDDAELRRIAEGVHGFSGRLAALPKEERELLGIAAYLGEQFNRDLLRKVAEKSVGWDEHLFEQLILSGLVAVAVPSIRLGSRESDGRNGYAFTHTLLWKAACHLDITPTRSELLETTLDVLTSGAGELYSVAPLEGIDVALLDDTRLLAFLRWLSAVGNRLPPIYSESFVGLCRAALEAFRAGSGGEGLDGELLDAWLRTVTIYGDRLYLIGATDELNDVAEEITRLLDRYDTPAEATADRLQRLEAAVVVWHNSLVQGDSEPARTWLDPMLEVLPPPAEQTDRELRGAAEAIRLRAGYSFERGEFAEAFDLAAPYLPELDRMQPETLNALMKVLLYAMIASGRLDEAREMVDAGLRLRSEADLFTTYELLLHAANFAWHVREIAALKSHATELRALVDRYPAYRGLSTNFWHLPFVLAWEADPEGMARLEREFLDNPRPSRSTPMQTEIARMRFVQCWNYLARPMEAERAIEEIDRSPLNPHQLRFVEREIAKAWIDRRLASDAADEESRPAPAAEQAGEQAEIDILLRHSQSALSGDPDPLRTFYLEHEFEENRNIDHMRAAHVLFHVGANLAGRKREFYDVAYGALERGLSELKEVAGTNLAHHRLDVIGDLLPRTRATRFRKEIGPDKRQSGNADSTESTESGASTETAGTILRTFGALRMEGEDAAEGGTKIESKTRSLVAALVVEKLGETRWIGELTRDRLADLLWPDMTLDRAVNNLHATTSYARRFLGGSDTIRQVDGVYVLSDDVRIDALEFRACIRKANRLHDEGVYFGAAVAYRSAVEQAEGDFLEGMYAEWIDTMRENLRGELATALERLIALEVDRDNYQAIPGLAERLLALDDLHDGAYEALIRSAATRGARREAFGYYKRYETALEEYGAGPTRRISSLIEKVRSGEEVGAVSDDL